MATVAGTADQLGPARKLGFTQGQVIQEFGYDDDVDFDLRDAIEALLGSELVDEDYQDVVDGVVLWWREDDGDLVDVLVDAQTTLADRGVIWVFTRKPGREGYVPPSDIEQAAPTAGVKATSTVSLSHDWTGTRLLTRRA